MTTQIKRKADTQLNPDNVDQINKFEPSGKFEKADPSELKTRTYYRVPKNDPMDNDNDFFDDDSDIVLDDDFAEPPKNTSPPVNNSVNDSITKDVSNSVSKVSSVNESQVASGSVKQTTKNADSEVSVSEGEQKSTLETGVTKPSFGVPKPDSPSHNPSTDSKSTFTGSGTFSSFTNHSKTDNPSPKTTNVFGFGTQQKENGQGLTSSSGSFSSFKASDGPTQSKTPNFGFSGFGGKNEQKEQETKQAETKSEKSPSRFSGSFGVAQKTFAGLKQQSQGEKKASFVNKSNTPPTEEMSNTENINKDEKPVEEKNIRFGTNSSTPDEQRSGAKKSFGFGMFKSGNDGEKGTTGFSGFGSSSSGENKRSGFGFGFSSGGDGEKKPVGFSSFGSGSYSGFGSSENKFTSFADVKNDQSSFTGADNSNNSDSPVSTIGVDAIPTLQKPDQQLSTGEEDETEVFKNRARLYKFADGKYQPIGRGNLKLNKNRSENKYRLLLRSEGGLKLIFNAALFKELIVKKLDEKSLSVSAINFCDPEPERSLSTYLIRLENGAELFTAIEGALKSLSE